ncbi:UNVERIFIED_CONTAM: SDR family mycofactocin-dependent oxidoreductase [Williamsia faeni]
MGDFDGKVVYITGIARGQGRSHAIRFAEEGAAVIGLDVCRSVTATGYPAATAEDLEETVRLVKAAGGSILARQADTRDLVAQQQLVADGVAQFGRLDHVIANAGVLTWGGVADLSESQFTDVIDINVNGSWKTLKATIPAMIEAGNGGSIVIISSVAGIKAMPMQASYSASKHALVGLAHTTAKELGQHRIRVNTVHPYGVDTPMCIEDTDALAVFEMPQYRAHFEPILSGMAKSGDITDAVMYLCSKKARFITASSIEVDMGATKV